jgi:HlyD family secretion protein
VKQREALLKQAEMDLERTIIRAPVDGTVILRNVAAGQSVAVSRPPAVLFSIAQDLREVQVEAVIDEADARRLHTGMPASFAVDAFPRRSFTGEIRQIRKSPQTGSTIVISVDNADLALLPGMEANVRVILDSRTGALKVPNAALGFHPPGAKASAGRLWLLEAGEPKPVDVRLGLSDGTVTEVVSGGLKEADEIIIGVASPS